MATRTPAQAGKPLTDDGRPPVLSEHPPSADPAMDILQDLLPPLMEASRKPLQPGLQPTAQTLAGISYLQRVLDTHDYADLHEPLMIDRVGLNLGNDGTVTRFGSPELLGRALNEDMVCEMHGGDSEDGIVGTEIEVFWVREHCWISAFVAGVCDEGYLLMFFDGVLERVSLANKAWRLAL